MLIPGDIARRRRFGQSPGSGAAGWRRWAVDWLYPPRCLACDADVADPGGLCSSCWGEAVFLAGAVCRRCGALDPYGGRRPVAARAPDFLRRCADCPQRPVAFTEARAAMAYHGAGRTLPLALKHGDRTDVARAMGRWMARAGLDLRGAAPELGPPLIAPAPLHWRRRLARRGDQAAALARVVAALWDAPLADAVLRRRRATVPQASLEGAEARWRNLRAAFVVAPGRAGVVAGRRVVLVDDVMTTGATLDACAAALLAAGAARVDALVFARPCKAALTVIGADLARAAGGGGDHGTASAAGAAIASSRAAIAPRPGGATSAKV